MCCCLCYLVRIRVERLYSSAQYIDWLNNSVYLFDTISPNGFGGQGAEIESVYDPWICLKPAGIEYDSNFSKCGVTRYQDVTNWTYGGYSISCCLSKKIPHFCKIQFSVAILVAVILCNLIKSMSMLKTLWRQMEAPLFSHDWCCSGVFPRIS